VRQAVGEAPLSVALAAVELPRSTWYYNQRHVVDYEVRHADLRAPLEAIATEHPAYGYRRVRTELAEVYKRVVNHKVIRRLHRRWDLSLLRQVRRPKPSGIYEAIQAAGERANLVAALDSERIEPFAVTVTDFTELPYADGERKAQFVPLVDCASKLISGWALSASADTETALSAWAMATRTWRAHGIDYRDMIVHHDQGSAFISYEWVRQLRIKDDVRVSFALRGAKDNTFMEGFNSRFKVENVSLFLDARTLGELVTVVDERVRYYNHERRHSTLGNMPPSRFLGQLGFGAWRPES
jgi:transposase InsO family protein